MQNPHGIDLAQTTEILITQSFSTGRLNRLMRKQGPKEITRYRSLHKPTKRIEAKKATQGQT